jgi:hypothetical protein
MLYYNRVEAGLIIHRLHLLSYLNVCTLYITSLYFVNKTHCDEGLNMQQLKNGKFKQYFEYLSHSELIDTHNLNCTENPQLKLSTYF